MDIEIMQIFSCVRKKMDAFVNDKGKTVVSLLGQSENARLTEITSH